MTKYPADLTPGACIIYRNRRLTIVSIRSVKDVVYERLFYVEATDEAGCAVSLSFTSAAQVRVCD